MVASRGLLSFQRTLFVAAAVLGAIAATPALAQQALYSNSGGAVTNSGLATGMNTASGLAAPPGAMWSELQTDATGATNAAAGFSGHETGVAGAYRFADDFVVAGDSWTLTNVSVYAYQTGVQQPSITSANVRIWSGRPGDAGSTVVWGDTSTDRLLAATSTNIYRVFNSVAAPVPPAPDTGRVIWNVNLSLLGAVLQPGTYWLDWQLKTSPAGIEVFSPAVTVAGLRAKAGSNAVQLKPGGAWTGLVDAGKPLSAADVAQDLPFIISGYSGNPPCPSDVNADGFVNGVDFDQFTAAFDIGDLFADFDHNGFVNGVDFDAFVSAFEAGC